MTTNPISDAAGIVAFWRQAGVEKWFGRSTEFDEQCRGLLGL